MDKDHYRKEPKLKEKMKRQFSEVVDDTKMIMNHEDTAPEARTHECNICGKSFNNGKALGGHRRSHFQAAKKNKHLPNKVSRYATDDENDGDEKTTCYICKKNFPTKNALYGHMRSHPDRVSKGVSPPTARHENNNCSSSNNSNSSMEQNKQAKDDGSVVLNGDRDSDYLSKPPHIPKWQIKGQRGRKCSESYEAATTLVLLTKCCVSVELEKPKVPMPIKKRKIVGESSSIGNEHAVNKIKFVFGNSLKLGKKSDDGGECDTHDDKVNSAKTNKTETTKKLAFDLNEPYVED